MSGCFLEALSGKRVSPLPLWMMRQAGRYLPEYREMREKAGSFWTLCNTPELAAEVTLQPIRRFGFDAAIIFSDILVIASALGWSVTFDEGPKLQPLRSAGQLDRSIHNWSQKLRPVYETIALVRANLEPEKALLGFAGAPWTLATYLAGGRNDEQMAAKFWAYREPDGFAELVDVLVDCVAHHLVGQLKAGADAVQLFDSWAANLAPKLFMRWVVEPTRKIVTRVRMAVPGARIIGFPRGASQTGLEEYVSTGVNAMSLDASVPLDWAVERLGKKVVLQGNLDPLALVVGGRALRHGVDEVLQATQTQPFIFNLGHGVLPGTPIEHVQELIKLVRA